MAPRKSTLSNGLRIVTDDMPYLETTSLGIWVDVGARYEQPELNGVSHLLEHMAFKGTDRRTALDIAEEIEAVGGHLNAYTSREHTAYFAHVLKDDAGLALDILADILQHSSFAPEELERERAVVIQEIGQTKDSPEEMIFEYLQETAYPKQPLGRSILGSAELVSGMQRETIAGYMADHYRGPRMVLAAAGRVDHDKLTEMAESLLSGIDGSDAKDFATASYGGGDHRLLKELEQAHLALAFRGVALGHKDYYSTHVAATVLGGGMASRLFQEVREKRGLAYAVYSFCTSYQDDGLFGVYAGTGEAQTGELVSVVTDEVLKLADDASDSEVARARAQLKAGLWMSLESPSARAEQMAKQTLVYGHTFEPDELIAKVDAVSAADVRRVLKDITAAGPLTLAALGPVAGFEAYDRVAAKFN